MSSSVILLLLLSIMVALVHAEIVLDKKVKFDDKFGGLHIDGVEVGEGTGIGNPRFKMMLSTVNSRTFLVDGRSGNCPEENIFCKDHTRRYDPTKSRSKKGDAVPLVGHDLNKGSIVTDYIKLDQLIAREQKFGIMNEKAGSDPNYWGIEQNDKVVIKNNLADGCLSLLAGTPEDKENYGDRTLMQNLIDAKKKEMMPSVSIRLDRAKELDEQTPEGHVFIGGWDHDPQCSGWTAHETRNASWTMTLDSLRGLIDGVKQTQEARIDTTSDRILVPKSVWEAQEEGFAKTGEDCVLNKVATLELVIGGEQYRVPSVHLLRKKTDNSSQCELLVGQNPNGNATEWQLGLPFLRSACVGMDFGRNQLWLGGNKADKQKGDGNGALPSLSGAGTGLLMVLAAMAIQLILFA